MMGLIELIEGIVELWCSWRFYVCLCLAAGIAISLHNTFPHQSWVWFVSVPTVIAGIGLGFRWQARADKSPLE
jgi:hypothetical protein